MGSLLPLRSRAAAAGSNVFFILPRLNAFAHGQHIASVFMAVFQLVHGLLDHEYPQAADSPLLRGEGHVRVGLLQRIEGHAAVGESDARHAGGPVKVEPHRGVAGFAPISIVGDVAEQLVDGHVDLHLGLHGAIQRLKLLINKCRNSRDIFQLEAGLQAAL